ncbi:MAG: nucleotide triphosphate diphosphatase NUDT15 [Desulfitobacteriaceae bacterium]
MKIKQVFSAYNFRNNDGLEYLNYCPRCGEKCIIKKEGGKKRPICPACEFVQYRNPSPAVSALVVKNDRVLLGKRAPGSYLEGKWCSPCGFIEFDEDFITAGIREVKEETGLNITVKSVISVCSNYLSPNLHSLVIVLLAHVVSGELCPGDDIDTLQWFNISGPLPQMAFSADIHIIERYNKTRIEGLQIDSDFVLRDE